MRPTPITPRTRKVLDDGAIYTGRTLRFGRRVTVHKRAGTFKPVSTGHAREVVADAGATGVLEGFAAPALEAQRRKNGGDGRFIMLVRFDAQGWVEAGSDTRVALPAFTASIHADYLTETDATDAAP